MVRHAPTFSTDSAASRSWLTGAKVALLFGLLAPMIDVQAKQTAPLNEIERGRRIYMEGILSSGKPLQGKRLGTVSVEGATAACQNCHRQSGMGSLEGNVVAPPIGSHFLFAQKEDQPLAIVDIRQASNIIRPHAPYNETSFAKALQDGINVMGKKMNPLMPHYALDKQDRKALMAYLKQLSADNSPGVTDDGLEFAVIVAPGVATAERDAMLTMVQKIFTQRNTSLHSHSGQMKMPLDLVPRKPRTWRISAWELKGEPSTWAEQLQAYYDKKPVFAVVGGMANGTWEPVNAFCSEKKLPCLLPHASVVPDQPGFYNLYFSHGVALEASVLAKHLGSSGDKQPQRVVQVYREDAAGLAGSSALDQALKAGNIKLESRKLASLEASEIQAQLKDLQAGDDLMLWLSPEDLTAVAKAIPTITADKVYVSGFLAKDNYAFVPETWTNLRVIYPYELGNQRQQNMGTVGEWLMTYAIPTVNEPMQSELYFNMLFLTDLISQLLDNFYRDYFVERAEDMLSWGSNVSPYPHLSLSRGQRYASKGAYIAKSSASGELVAETDWIVP